MDAQRALLDELMGAARNLTEEEKRGFKEIKWNDDEVCPCYMVRFCPHDLFVNTRSDLGPCPKIHDLKLKERYGDPDVCIFSTDNQQCRRFIGKMINRHFENSPRHDAYVPKFEAQLAQFCEKLVTDLDRRVRRGRERLEQEVEPAPPPPLSAEKAEQLSTLEEKIKNLLEQVESLGEEGKVDEAEALMRKVEILNAEKKSLTQPQNEKLLMLTQEKKMALCEICGSFLIANDAAERVQSHVTGKQHIGYGMVRDFIAEFKAGKEKKKEEERLSREKEAEERRKQREKEQDIRRSGLKDRDRYREPSSGRDREREGDHHRDRSRNYESSRDRNGMGRRDGGRVDWRSRNGRDATRDRYRDRSRSHSPGRHGYKRASRSPSR